MMFAILSFVLAAGIFFFYAKPAYTGPGTTVNPSVTDMKAQIVQYDDALQKVAQLQQLKAKLLAKYNSFNPDDINRLQTLLPDHVDNIGLILELDSLASRYGMTLENVDVNSDSQAAAASAPAKIGSNTTIGQNQKYDSLTLHFSTFGTYDKFNSLLQDLEASLRIVDLSSLKFSAQQTSSSNGQPTYNYDITIRTYWLK